MSEHRKFTLDEMIEELHKRIKKIVSAGIEIDNIAFKARITGEWQNELTNVVTKQRHKYENAIKVLERKKNEQKTRDSHPHGGAAEGILISQCGDERY